MDFEKLVEELTEEVYKELVKNYPVNQEKNVQNVEKISRYIDHTLLKATATENDIENLCNEAIKYDFYSVCVNSYWVKKCYKILKDTNVKVCAVVGFPLGAAILDAKEYECRRALLDGASEIDMVINIGELKNKNYSFVKNEIENLKKICNHYDAILKVIIETCYLSEEEIKKASLLCVEAGADFVKTSTGFGTGGAKIEDVKLIKNTVGEKAKVKAAGGIRNYEIAIKMIEAGADRIGTSSGVKIVEEEKSTS